MNTVKYVTKKSAQGLITESETTQQPEQTRIRVSFTVSAKGQFQADITSEAETLVTGMANLNKAVEEMEALKARLIATGKLDVKAVA